MIGREQAAGQRASRAAAATSRAARAAPSPRRPTSSRWPTWASARSAATAARPSPRPHAGLARDRRRATPDLQPRSPREGPAGPGPVLRRRRGQRFRLRQRRDRASGPACQSRLRGAARLRQRLGARCLRRRRRSRPCGDGAERPVRGGASGQRRARDPEPDGRGGGWRRRDLRLDAAGARDPAQPWGGHGRHAAVGLGRRGRGHDHLQLRLPRCRLQGYPRRL